MQDCSPGAAPWCGKPLIHNPNLENLEFLSSKQISLYIKILQTAIHLLRGDASFNDNKAIFGNQILYYENSNTYIYVHPDIREITLKIGLTKEKDRLPDSVVSFDIIVQKRLVGLDKDTLENRLELQRASNYVKPPSLDRRADIDFPYETGLDLASCYPVSIYLNYFKDEAYETTDPRADSEAKYLGHVSMHRDYMTPAKKAERARRVPQCRSRQPTPRSGLWQPSIPHDAPYAAYFKKQEAVSYRVKKGDPMIAVGLDAPNEARVLWTWVGE